MYLGVFSRHNPCPVAPTVPVVPPQCSRGTSGAAGEAFGNIHQGPRSEMHLFLVIQVKWQVALFVDPRSHTPGSNLGFYSVSTISAHAGTHAAIPGRPVHGSVCVLLALTATHLLLPSKRKECDDKGLFLV